MFLALGFIAAWFVLAILIGLAFALAYPFGVTAMRLEAWWAGRRRISRRLRATPRFTALGWRGRG